MRPASIFEKSRMSLMIVSSASLRRADDRRLLALLVVELASQQQPAHADHRVHRRADLVAHRCQERALGRVGRVGRVARLLSARVQPRVVERDHGQLGEPLEPLDLGLPRTSRSSDGVACDSERAERRVARYAAERSPSRRSGRGGSSVRARPSVVVLDHGGLERLHDATGQTFARATGEVDSRPRTRPSRPGSRAASPDSLSM